jgi:eukaryotic-like serine/threonine-protein kinase
MGIERPRISANMTQANIEPAPDLQQVRALFDAASATDGSARQALLDAADPELRGLVADLLQSDREFHPVLDRPLVVPTPRQGLFEEGDCTGRYRIVREIAAGGMGSVYLAELADRDSSPRFALKVVRFPSQELARRLADESRILSRLEHPNIARLLDVGTTSSGLPFLVMEYVDGRPIHQYCPAKHMPPADCARLFRQVCAAVRYLHRNLVVHRDLKPANILVTEDGTVKVVDFGIAKLIERLDHQASARRGDFNAHRRVHLGSRALRNPRGREAVSGQHH